MNDAVVRHHCFDNRLGCVDVGVPMKGSVDLTLGEVLCAIAEAVTVCGQQAGPSDVKLILEVQDGRPVLVGARVEVERRR